MRQVLKVAALFLRKIRLRVGVKLSLEDVILSGVLKKIGSLRSSLLPKILIVTTIIPLSLYLISTAWATPADESAASGSLGDLTARASELDASYNQALTDMVAADSEVGRYSNEIAGATERRGQIQYDIESTKQHIDELHTRVETQRDALARRLCTTYKSDDVGYLEVILGAGDFSEFLDRVDLVSMIADEDSQLIDSINQVRQSEEDKMTTLSQKQDELDSLIVELSNAKTNLEGAQAQQQTTIADIEAQMQDNQGQMEQLSADAAAIETRMDELQSAATVSGGDDDTPAPADGSSISMTATAYCMSGTTATGMPVGRGIIAVDPSVIPLGTRVHVSGYGDAIAADVGGAINGNTIDVWLPCSEAYAWGTRTVDVTIY